MNLFLSTLLLYHKFLIMKKLFEKIIGKKFFSESLFSLNKNKRVTLGLSNLEGVLKMKYLDIIALILLIVGGLKLVISRCI